MKGGATFEIQVDRYKVDDKDENFWEALKDQLERWEGPLEQHNFGLLITDEKALLDFGNTVLPGLIGQDGKLLHSADKNQKVNKDQLETENQLTVIPIEIGVEIRTASYRNKKIRVAGGNHPTYREAIAAQIRGEEGRGEEASCEQRSQ